MAALVARLESSITRGASDHVAGGGFCRACPTGDGRSPDCEQADILGEQRAGDAQGTGKLKTGSSLVEAADEQERLPRRMQGYDAGRRPTNRPPPDLSCS